MPQFTIQDKIDIYINALAIIEAGVKLNITATVMSRMPTFLNTDVRYSMCNILYISKQWYGTKGYIAPNSWGSETCVESIWDHVIFPEWYALEPKKQNRHFPYWWSNTTYGDRQRCRHIRKILRQLYKQLSLTT